MNGIAIVVALLTASESVAAVVPKTAIFPIKAPQGVTAPYIVLNIAGDADEQMLNGTANYPETRIEAACYATTGTAALLIADAVQQTLGNVVKQIVGAARDVDIYFANFKVTEEAEDGVLARVILHFYVRWRNAA